MQHSTTFTRCLNSKNGYFCPDEKLPSDNGEHVVSTTLIETLLDKGFKLIINDTVYNVQSSETACTSREHAVEMEDVKHVVHMLHTALHLPEHHLQKERQLLEKLDHLKQELSPLEKMKAQLCRTAEFKASRVLWTGLAFLSVQGGALAWLTWWVYSWDVMEPVTYFITYSTSIGVFSYYVLTKQDYVYLDAKDRQFLHYFYKGASKKKFNVKKYNELKDDLAQVEEELKRLRCSTQLQMPLEQIQSNVLTHSQASLATDNPRNFDSSVRK
ncbi:calcium uniporter regulatory subunit MCUb, mitochondrial-like [Anabas testudineus]|uniref:calcium uniporter regulatory subunit MCUb, mitochondrial-like n=1 Tax=Anabas testudineus TaxID=64144 RepID=UPI000E45A8BD|nr:calcium uniporter regulatory subunit MCUb, mitochondrial-like [Anabas testudineus]